jgi:hypothetical protein
MADVQVSTNWRFVYHDPKCLVSHPTNASVLYFVYVDSSDNDLKYRKSTNAGAGWSAATTIRTGTVAAVAVWADWWTPGDAGTVLHTLCIDEGVDDVFYRPLDTSTDSLGTETTVYAGTTLANGALSITKTRGGNLLAGWNGSATELGFARSTDNGGSWAARTSPWESQTADQIDLFPGNEADNQDAWALFHDASANELSLKTYDDSGNSWSEAAIAAMSANLFEHSQSGTIRHSDNHLLVSIMTGRDVATCDLLVYDVNGAGSITAKTTIVTDKDDMAASCIFCDQRNSDVYVLHIGKSDGSETFNTSIKLYRHKSTDGMTSWQAEAAANESLDNIQYLFGSPMGARWIAGWMSDDFFFTYNLYVSSVLSIDLAGAVLLPPPVVMAPPVPLGRR